jgi:hypothetical protein
VVIQDLVRASGCGSQGCSARMRAGNVAATCERPEFTNAISNAVCHNQRVVSLEDAHDRFERNVDDIVADTPEGSIGVEKTTAPTTTQIGDGRKAGDIIGFIVLCALLVACIIPMTILFFRWLFLSIKNFDSGAFMARFGK